MSAHLLLVEDDPSISTPLLEGLAREGFAVQHAATGAAAIAAVAGGSFDVVARVKNAMPGILAGLPPELDVREFADQSLFVRASIEGVVREAVIAAHAPGTDFLFSTWEYT